MAFSAILRKSASSLVIPTASRLARANKNFYSAVLSVSSHLNRKPILGSFVPDFEFSSTTETKKCSSIIELLLHSIDSKIKLLDDQVEEPLSEFTLKIDKDTHRFDHTTDYHVVLTREYRGELVEVSSQIYDHTNGKGYGLLMVVTINNHSGSSLRFDCLGTSDAISIWNMNIINSENSKDSAEFSTDEQFHNKVYPRDMDENLVKAFLEYLEIRGIKPSIVDSMIKCIKEAKRKLMGLKKIKNFIEQLP